MTPIFACLIITLSFCVRTTFSTGLVKAYGEQAPFRQIKLVQYFEHHIQPETGKRTLGFGQFEAHGPVEGLVTKRAFIRFTNNLAKHVLDKWNVASDEQKGVCHPNIVPLPPVCSGLLMGTGPNARYTFVSQVRPFERPVVGWQGETLFSQTLDKHVDARYSYFLKSGEELRHHLLTLQKELMWRADELRLKLVHWPSSSNEHLQLEQSRRNAINRAAAITLYLDQVKKRAERVKNDSRHIKNNKCSECTVIGRVADNGQAELLDGAWLVSFGVVRGRNNNYWGIQNACTGGKTFYGCKDLLQHNGVQDLFADGLALSQGRYSPGLIQVKRGV